jgi:NMT1/THI5 like
VVRSWTIKVSLVLALVTAGADASMGATVRIGVPERDNIQFLTLWVALGAGYLQAEGLDVQLVVADVPNQSGQLVPQSQADVALLQPPVFLGLIAQQRPIVLFANLLANDPINLIVRPNIAAKLKLDPHAPLKERITALKGLRIGVANEPPRLSKWHRRDERQRVAAASWRLHNPRSGRDIADSNGRERADPNQRAHSWAATPNFIRLSAVATIASSRDRGLHPSTRSACAFVAWRVLSSSGSMGHTVGSNSATTRTSQFGNCRVGTFVAASPRRVLSIVAMSSIDMIPPETAMKRSPFAARSVIARRSRSATSRTSASCCVTVLHAISYEVSPSWCKGVCRPSFLRFARLRRVHNRTARPSSFRICYMCLRKS